MGQAQPTQTTRLKTAIKGKQAEAWHLLENDATVEELWYGGAAGGGKSWLGCLWKMYRRIKYAGTRGVIGRNSYTDLRDSTLQTFLKLWNDYGRYNPFGITGQYNANDKVFYFSNGSQEYFRHLAFEPSDPDYHRFGSKEYTDAFIDEAQECDEKAFDMVSSRIRYELDQVGGIPKILGCGNPSANWTKWRYIKDREGKPVTLRPYQKVVRAFLSDNPDPVFQERYRKQLEKLPWYDQQRLLEGDYDAEEPTGGEFYHAYIAFNHKRPTPFLAHLPIVHLTLDQNTLPHYTGLLFQVVTDSPDGRMKLRFFDEVCLPPPRATTAHVCREVKRRYGSQVESLFYYGDASGNKNDTRDNRSDYDILRSELAEFIFPASNRVGTRNLSVRKRGEFVNEVLEGKHGVDIEIDPRCTNLLDDLAKCKTDENGGKLKKRVTDHKTGQSFEPVGHAGDALEYALCAVLKSQWERFLHGKAQLLTHE